MKLRIVVLLLISLTSMSTVGAFGILANRQSKIITPAAAGQTGVAIRLANQTGGSVEAVAQSGSYVYVGRGPRLVVYNAQNAAQPVYLTQSEILADRISYLAVNGDYIYAAAGNNIAIFNVQNPANPALVSYQAAPARVDAIAIQGSYAFIVQTGAFDAGSYPGSGFYVYNISNPANLVQEAYLSYNQGSDFNIMLNGNYAYLAANYRSQPAGAIIIIDVSNPAAPVERNVIPHSNLSEQAGIAISNTMMYVGDYLGFPGAHVISTYALTQPVTPTHQSFSGSFFARSISVKYDTAYVAGSSSGFYTMDLTNPATPSRNGSYRSANDPATNAVDVAVFSDTAYVASSFDGLHIVDVSTHNLTATATFKPLGVANDIDIDDQYIYVTTIEGGLHLLRRTDLSEVGFYEYEFPTASHTLEEVKVQGNYVYASDPYSTLYIIDVSNPVTPTRLYPYYVANNIQGIDIAGQYAFLAVGLSGVDIIDISNPLSISSAGSIAYGNIDNIVNVDASGNYAYLADLGKGLHIADVSNVPFITRTLLSLSGGASAVSINGNYAYVISSGETLHVVDVSTPLNPIAVYSQTITTNINTLKATNNYLYIGTSTGKLFVYDISVPSAPLKIVETMLPDSITQFALNGNTAYVANSRAGLYVFGAELLNQVYLPVIVKQE